MSSSAATPGGPPRGPQFDNRRIAAGLIDLVLVAVVAAAILFAAGALGGDSEMTGALRLVVVAWALFYYFAMETGAGQTVGKRLMGLRVLTVDGGPAGYREIGLRTVLRVIDGIGFYLVGLIVMLVTGERRQRLGDLAGKTCVTSADWKGSTAADVTTVAVASTGAAAPTSAIVLPTAEPAGTAFETPESTVPQADHPAAPSPFTTFDDSPVVEQALPLAPVSPPASEEPAVVVESRDADEPVSVEETTLPPAFPVSQPVTDASPVVEESDVVDESPVVEGSDVVDESPVVEEPAVVEASAPPAWPKPDLDAVVDGPADGTWDVVPEPAVNGSAPSANGSHAAGAVDSPPPAVESAPAEADEADEDDPAERVHIRTVETLSAMDLLMSEIDDEDRAGGRTAG